MKILAVDYTRPIYSSKSAKQVRTEDSSGLVRDPGSEYGIPGNRGDARFGMRHLLSRLQIISNKWFVLAAFPLWLIGMAKMVWVRGR